MKDFQPSRRMFLGSAATNLIVASGLPSQYRLVRAEGTHRELGRQHGEQAAELIRAHVDLVGRSREQLRLQALKFKPLFEKYCPHLLDEITGLGEGAGITLAEALA